MTNMVKAFLKSIIIVPIKDPLLILSSHLEAMPISAVHRNGWV